MKTFINIVHYFPILSTIISAFFSYSILSRYNRKHDSKHLFWWGIGVAVYGAGTLVESINTLFGWNVIIFKTWYITGALLGGAPLAIGTVYLLSGKKAGDILSKLLIIIVSITSIFVILSPIEYHLVDSTILSSKVLTWQSIRMVSPFINSFAAIFLIGGAIYSSILFFKKADMLNRAIGNIFIAVGAILPGIGGFYSRIGYTEVLYAGELFGIILIWIGYKYCLKPRPMVIKMESAVS